jgi:HrpA-like RNA helicase
MTTSSSSRKKDSKNIKHYTISKNIGIYDPNGLYNNPFTNQPYQNIYSDELTKDKIPMTYINLAKDWSDKIVYNNKDIIIDSIINNQITLAKAGTGVGKTILIPRIAIHAFDYKEKVICTIPKKLTTRSTADFVAKCMDVKLGEHVGYFYKDDNSINKNGIETKLSFTTPGSLISSMVGSDPLLSNYKCVIVDEAHERSVETDLLLLLLKKACLKRKDLKIVIMSATIDLDKFRNYFPSPLYKFGEINAGSHTSYKITSKFLDRSNDWKALTIDTTMRILKKTAVGDIMIFVKAKGDAVQLCAGIDKAMNDFRKTITKKTKKSSRTKTQTKTQTKTHSKNNSKNNSKTKKQLSIPPEYEINPYCITLDGKTSKTDTDLATSEHKYKGLRDSKGYPYTRKIVITTNVAESSITVNGIIYVIDSGLEYTASYEPSMRVRALLESNVAQSAVHQRKGRAGRTQDGYSIHLYSEKEYNRFEEYPTPAIEKEDITMNILDLLRMHDISTLKKMRDFLDEFISPPHEKFIINALNTLYALGAITSITNEGTITPMGLAICKFRALEPNFARSLIASHFYGCSKSICDIIALATIADGRLDSIFLKYRDDKKKSKEVNKKEYEKHKRIMKSYQHHYGDYMSMLHAYKMYITYDNSIKDRKKLEKEKQEQDQLDQLQHHPELQTSTPIPLLTVPELIFNKNSDDDEDEENHYDMKSSPSMNKWCKDNYMSANKMSKVRKLSGDLYRTLQTTLRPYQVRAPFKQLSKADKHLVNMIEVNEVLDTVEPDYAIDLSVDTDIDMTINITQALQSGGFVRQINKEEELQKLEPNVKRFPNEEDNIMMSLAIGNFINLAKLKKGYSDVYESCFAEKKKMAKINMDSFVKDNPNLIIYHELFMSNENTKFLKLNMVNKLPNNVWEKIKTDYGQFIKFCL